MSPTVQTSPQAPVDLPLAQLRESKTNPRRALAAEALTELTASLKTYGLLQPILVRPLDGHYEIVCGHCRFRAAKAAGFATIAAQVRELDDKAALEIQLTENLQRADLTELEEAEGYRRLRDDYCYSVDDLVARCGKTKAYIYARLKLCAMTPAAMKAYAAGQISASVGLLVARIGNAAFADQALKEILNRATHRDVSYREAAELVQVNYMLRLADAAFPTNDATLIKAAGTCTACPKRTGNCPDLYPDVKGKDICTDPACYRNKTDAQAQRVLGAARKDGLTVLAPKQAEKMFDPYGGGMRYNAPYVTADTKAWEYSNKGETFKKLLGKHAPPATVAIDPKSGTLVELYAKKDLDTALRAAGKKVHRASSGGSGRSAKDARAARVQTACRNAVLGALVASAEKSPSSAEWWAALASAAIQRAWHDTLKEVVARRGLEVDRSKQGMDEALLALVRKNSAGVNRGLLLEVMLTPAYPHDHGYGYSGGTALLDAACKALEVNRKAVEKAATKQLEAKAKPAKKAPAKKKGA